MFPFTAGKMVSYEDIRAYLLEKNVPQIFESIMTGLMYHRPEDHLGYMEDCLSMLRQNDVETLSWNTFIECSSLSKRSSLSNHEKGSLLPAGADGSSRRASEAVSEGDGSVRNVATNKKTIHSLINNQEATIPDCPIIFITGAPASGIAEIEQKITFVAGGLVCISLHAVAKDSHACENYSSFNEIPSGILVEDIVYHIQKFKDATAIIILGYPRNNNDVQSFVEMVCDVDAVILLDYKEAIYREKLQEEKGGSPLNVDSVEDQISYYKEKTLPTIDVMEDMGVLNIIDVEDEEPLLMDTLLSTINTIVENYTKGSKGTAIETESQQNKIERKQIDTTPLKNAKLPLLFVLGGPGSGKGTQCDLIVKKYGFTHLSSGDLLRDEVKSGSTRGQQLNASMEKGDLVPMEVVLDLIKEKMMNALPTSKGYLLDGYPREVIQGVTFEQEVCSCSVVLYFEVSDETMTKRLLHRGKTSGRVDDNEETIKKRLKTFHDLTKPVIDHYCGKVKTISAENHPDKVFEEVVKEIDSLQC